MASCLPPSSSLSRAELQSWGTVNCPQAGACARDGSGGARSRSPVRVQWPPFASKYGLGFSAALEDRRPRKWGNRAADLSVLQGSSLFGTTNVTCWIPRLPCKAAAGGPCSRTVTVANGNSDSKQHGSPGMPSRKRSLKKPATPKLGYHPLEDLPVPEKGKGLLPGEGQLSPAEVARTIAEVHVDGIVFASVVRDENAILGTDANYLVDPNGELFLELDDGDEFLQNLQNDQTCSILIGFGKMDDVSLSELIEEVDEGDEERRDGPDAVEEEETITEEDLKLWREQFPGGLSEMMETMSPEAMGSLGAWGGPETLKWVHPWEFAARLAEAVVADYSREMDFPTKRLIITGVVRRATEDEERRIRDLWDDRFSDCESDSEEIFSDSEDLGPRLLPVDIKGGVGKSTPRKDSKGVVRAGVWMGEPIKPRSKRGEKSDKMGGEEGGAERRKNGKEVVSKNGKMEREKEREREREEVEASRSRDEVRGDGEGEGEGGKLKDRKGEKEMEKEKEREGEANVSTTDVNIEANNGGLETWEGEEAIGIRVVGEEGTLQWSISNHDGSMMVEGSHGEGVVRFGELEDGTIIDIPIRSGWQGDSDWEEGEEIGASLYKVEILSIQLDSTSGIQESVEVSAWSAARPDMLAHTAPSIMERANQLDRAKQCMAELCLRERGVAVDEVSMVGIDHLGIDLRIRLGIELSTLRFPFLHPATTERAAEKLLDELLRPRQIQAWKSVKRNRQPKRFKGRYQPM